MSSKYEKMWDELGMDIPAHDGLLTALGNFYGDIYLSQEGRLKGAEYLDIVLQKSIREGFALTVSEALWKYRPVIGGAVGGIPAQIIHGYTGMLVHSVEGASLQIRTLLQQPDLARRLGTNGHERVKNEFLVTKLLKRYLLLLLALDSPGESTIYLK